LPSLPLCRQAVTRAYLLAWHRSLERRALASATIWRKLAALSSLFECLCETIAVVGNPVKGVKRPKMVRTEGKTPAIGDHQARAAGSARRRDAAGRARSRHSVHPAESRPAPRRGVMHLRIHGKSSKLRYVPLYPSTAEVIDDHL